MRGMGNSVRQGIRGHGMGFSLFGMEIDWNPKNSPYYQYVATAGDVVGAYYGVPGAGHAAGETIANVVGGGPGQGPPTAATYSLPPQPSAAPAVVYGPPAAAGSAASMMPWVLGLAALGGLAWWVSNQTSGAPRRRMAAA